MSIFLGLISGTSLDAIDAALIDISSDGIRLLNYAETPYSRDLRTQLEESIATHAKIHLSDLGSLHARIGHEFAAAAASLLEVSKIDRKDVVALGSHGQTLVHHPELKPPFSIQLGDPNIIAFHTGITTVADFRSMDLAAGGQGAPLVPPFHAELFGHAGVSRAVVNIGGIANITLLPESSEVPVAAFDTGPGNTLLDNWIRAQLGQAFDRNGAWAASGQVNIDLLKVLLAEEYFARGPPKSTGRELFNLGWLKRALAQCGEAPLSPADIQRTLVALTARSIVTQIARYQSGCAELILCGGGANNTLLLADIQAAAPRMRLFTTTELGVPAGAIEAMAFAWLAHRRVAGLPGNLPAVTGARQSVLLGGVYCALSDNS
ncbi:MAG: anhydro-N-acetylmuramic acid kinase [Gammaproteobacteria bacterium]|nr:anhydro-N-acetylmuramic acid kinase [Gammaproteobacteria bacterium]